VAAQTSCRSAAAIRAALTASRPVRQRAQLLAECLLREVALAAGLQEVLLKQAQAVDLVELLLALAGQLLQETEEVHPEQGPLATEALGVREQQVEVRLVQEEMTPAKRVRGVIMILAHRISLEAAEAP